MKIYQILLTVFVTALIVGMGVYVFTRPAEKPNLGAGIEIPVSQVATFSSSTATTTVATKVLSANPGVYMRYFFNSGASYDVIACVTTSTGFLATNGIQINASSSYEMSEANGNLCRGEIWHISSQGSPKLYVVEL